MIRGKRPNGTRCVVCDKCVCVCVCVTERDISPGMIDISVDLSPAAAQRIAIAHRNVGPAVLSTVLWRSRWYHAELYLAVGGGGGGFKGGGGGHPEGGG